MNAKDLLNGWAKEQDKRAKPRGWSSNKLYLVGQREKMFESFASYCARKFTEVRKRE